MGTKKKEHRKKVEKRNLKIKQQKSGMQKAFDLLLQQQMEKMKESNDLEVKSGNQDLNFEVVEERVIDSPFNFVPNEEESLKINKEFNDEDLREQYPLNVEGSDMPIDLKEMELSNTEIVKEDEQK